MKIQCVFCLGVVLLLLLQTCRGQNFTNLDFEDANVTGYAPGDFIPVIDAFPGWSASYSNSYPGGVVEASNVGYDAISLAGATISVNDKNSPSPIFDAIDGCYSAFLFGGWDAGASTPATLSQTGLVPIGTKWLSFSVQYAFDATPLIVSVNGQPINTGQYSTTSYDISSFAGQTVTLSFTEPAFPGNPPGGDPSLAILDDITFVPGPVPEPSTVSLIAISILILCLCSRMIWPKNLPEPMPIGAGGRPVPARNPSRPAGRLTDSAARPAVAGFCRWPHSKL